MGRDTETAKSKLIIQAANYKAAYEALDFCDDDDKTEQDNLIDCLQDFNMACVEKTSDSITCVIDDSNSDNALDWRGLSKLTAFLEESSYIEELIYDGPQLLVGAVKIVENKKKWVRDFYALKTDDTGQTVRGDFIENFDVDFYKD